MREEDVVHETGTGPGSYVVWHLKTDAEGRPYERFEIHLQGWTYAKRVSSWSASLPNARKRAIADADRRAGGGSR